MKRKISILLIMMLFISGLSSFTLAFNDVSNSHWAYDYINDMERSEIITGYSDGSFKPNKSVTKMSSMVMIYRMLKDEKIIDDEYIENVEDDYEFVLQRNNVPNWAKDAIVFGLDQEIIVEDELKTFVNSNGALETATKGEVSVFLGKALFVALELEKENEIYSFDFNDSITITFAMSPYIDLLVDEDIVSGDDQGNFNTNDEISRAVIAKMLSVAKELVDDEGIALDSEDEKDIVSDVSGEIVLISEDNNTLVIEDEDGEKDMYKLTADAKILINGDEEELDDLDEEDEVKLFLNDNNLVVKVTIDELDTYNEGEFYNIIGSQNEYLITLKNEQGDKHTFNSVDEDDTRFFINDEEVRYNELDKGMAIESIEYDGEKIEKLYLTSDPDTLDGVLLKGLYYRDKPYIKIRTYKGKELELEVDEDADVEKNNRDRSLKYLTKGDIVTVELDGGVVDEIIATSIEESSEGRIKSILISDTNQLTVTTDDGNEVVYDVDDQVDIEIDDDDDKDIYDLRLNYKVDLEVESGVIKEIEAQATSDSINFQGFVKTIYDDEEVISIDTDEFNEVVSVSCDDAKIYDDDGDRIGFDRIDEDDEVLIFAKEESSLFDYKAERIYIVE